MKRNTPKHPKMKELARALRINKAWAVGILETLWHFAVDYCPEGDIGRFGNGAIADEVFWPEERSPDELITALVAIRWLDEDDEHRLIVHDWFDHCDDYVHTKLARSRKHFATGQVPKMTRLNDAEKKDCAHYYGNCAHKSSKDAQKSLLPLPLPLPCPALPTSLSPVGERRENSKEENSKQPRIPPNPRLRNAPCETRTSSSLPSGSGLSTDTLDLPPTQEPTTSDTTRGLNRPHGSRFVPAHSSETEYDAEPADVDQSSGDHESTPQTPDSLEPASVRADDPGPVPPRGQPGHSTGASAFIPPETSKRPFALGQMKPNNAQAMKIYDEYPKKSGVARAVMAIKNALLKVPFEELLEATKAYAVSPVGRRPPKFIPEPAKWFEDEHWKDDRNVWLDGARPPPPAPEDKSELWADIIDKQRQKALR